jgi:SAM-dependent methyltransferase
MPQTQTAAAGPNARQIDYWNQTAGPTWVRHEARLDLQLEPFGAAAMDAAALEGGETVLDVGCGCGTTTLELARRVGPSGRVLGIDISAVMLERAAARARAAARPNARFERADAQTHPFAPASLDVVYSRFGVMFFADPGAAFANLRRALRPGGRLAFVCWQRPSENPWFLLPAMAAMRHLTIEVPTDPRAPGPFAFGEADWVREALAAGGFAEPAIEPLQRDLTVGGEGDLAAAVDFMLEMGPVGAAFREASDDTRRAVTTAVRAALAPYATAAGVRMASAAWVVTARAPR